MYLPLEKYLSKINFILILIFLAFSVNLSAQTKKKPTDKTNKKTTDSKTTAKKNDKKAVEDKKSSAKPSKKLSAKELQAEKEKQRKNSSSKTDKNSKSKQADSAKSKKVDLKKQAEENRRRAEEEARQRAIAEERRRQILAEQQRRAQLAREAQARRIAFERGLRTETIENISNDNLEGEDLEVRRAAVNALGNHAGTVLVMEAQTGKVLSIVNQDWAIRKSFKPCSTIKLVTAVAGINEERIGGDGKINSRRFPMNLDDALAYSNNRYFQVVGAGLGNTKMNAYARMLGLGQPTGINADAETGGKLPLSNNDARIYSHGDDFEVTPLQLGVMVSALSNGGKIVVPRIPKTRVEKANFRGAMRYQLALPGNNYTNVLPGMIGAAQYGTARRGMDQTLAVAGKTGSCIGNGSWVGLFASVAPIRNPKYSVVVITRGQSERGKIAAAIAGKIYASLKNRMVTSGTENLAKIPLDLKPQTKINATASAKIDVAEGEESEDNDAAKAVINNASAPKALGKKGGGKTENFSDVVIQVKKSEQLTRPRIVQNKE